ncbi:MAG: SpoIID/LytB domain-containing protein [Blastocatellia bacterium]|nr:SpoIID/LytB domain-containing protein [Blastocatellia bacterium]
MSSAFIAALIYLTAVPTAEQVRVGLFGLFKPEALDIRIKSGAGARLDAGDLSNDHFIAPGDLIRVQATGNRLSILVTDSYGRTRKSALAREARVSLIDSGTFELSLPGKIKRITRGRITLSAEKRGPRGALRIILATDRESAVASVVAAEIGGSREPEAIKALAVIARTFMRRETNRHRDEGFDFCDTTHCQVYRGEDDLSVETGLPVIASAVRATEGQTLGFEGKEIEVHFTASCGGLSATPEMVWGGASDDGYPQRRIACRWCAGTRFWKWQRSAEAAKVMDALSSAARFRLSQATEILIEKDGADGFVRSVTASDRGRRFRMSADEFRRHIGRRLGWNTVLSPTFQIELRGHSYIFRGRGFGSQVGLCLAGAVRQAAAGRTYLEILDFYYPQTEIKEQGSRGAGVRGCEGSGFTASMAPLRGAPTLPCSSAPLHRIRRFIAERLY